MLGNEILLKCDIPSFVADFVFVDGWVDSEGLAMADDGYYQGNDWSKKKHEIFSFMR